MTENILKINGYDLVIHPISPLAPKAIELKYRKDHPEPVRPSYTVESVVGVVETFPHNETTLDTDEEKEAYLAWKEADQEWQEGLTYRLVRLFLLKGVELRLTKAQEKALNDELEVMDLGEMGETEKKLFFLETFILNSQDNLQKVFQAVSSETGVSQEVLESADSLF